MKRVGIKVAGSALVLALLFWVIPWQDIRTPLARFDARVWLGVWAGFVVGHGVGVWKWRSLLAVGRARLRLREAAGCYGAGLFANLCLPSIVGGDVLRAVLATRRVGRGEAVALGSVADRVLDLTALGLWLGVGGLVAGARLEGWAGPAILLALMLATAAGVVVGVVVWRRPLVRWPARHRARIGKALVALRRLRRCPRIAAQALLLALAIQGGFVLLNAWIGHTVGLPVSLGAYFLAWPLAKIVGLLPVSLGGLGVRDGTYSALLVPLGASAGDGLAASLIWQSVLLGGGLVGGALYGWQRFRGRGRERAAPELLRAERSHG